MMVAEDLINEMIPPLKLSDTGEKAKHWMEELRLSQLPVVDKNIYQGLLLEETLLNAESLNKKISDFRLDYKDLNVSPGTHYYDVIKLATRNKLHILPVINEDKKFLGVVSLNETAAAIAQMFASQGPGGILLLSMKEQDYSMAQISRLIESNDCKILSSFVVSDEGHSGQINLTLKLSKTELARTVATLERYGYNVITQFHETELINNDQERLDLLMKYLNM
jgi:acetoin utilization protein AcuB